MTYRTDLEREGGRRQVAGAVGFLVAALVTFYMPDPAQQSVAWALRASVLRPFISTQEKLEAARLRTQQVELLRGQLDSLAAVLSTHGSLADENRSLRGLLELSARVGPAYTAASLIRPGTAGSESMFLIFLGAEHGVRAGAPIITRHGLVGVVREVRDRTAVGMDWTHPDFRVSAMLGDGTGFGIVENRRGAFREEDRLLLNGTAYYEPVAPGAVVLTSGLGGVYPRGIPIGFIDGVAEAEGRWRKSYWLRPMVDPASVTHVLVAIDDRTMSLESVWPQDSVFSRTDAVRRELILEDSVRLLRSMLEERAPAPPGGGP